MTEAILYFAGAFVCILIAAAFGKAADAHQQKKRRDAILGRDYLREDRKRLIQDLQADLERRRLQATVAISDRSHHP
jgi:hypothetical protein